MITPDKDPMGAAIADFFQHHKASKLRVFSPDFDEDEIPVAFLFRTKQEMPPLEQKALTMASGRILDVGAGAGCHALALQEEEKEVVAIDISPCSVETMTQRGVKDARMEDFWQISEPYDTILMLMNGIGIVGKVSELPRFFKHLDTILAPGGQLLLDSSDLCYLYETDDDIIEIPDEGHYYGEVEYTMKYKNIKGDAFPWLYVDFDLLASIGNAQGYNVELVEDGEHYDYLARITKQA